MIAQETERKLTLEEAVKVYQTLLHRENLAVRLFRPMETQAPFFRSHASERLARGGARSGKTVVCAVEVGSAAIGIPVRSRDGKQFPYRYLPRPNGMTIWIVGYDEKHIGRTIWAKLFEPGLFKCIKDEKTGRLRAYDPETDRERESEVVPSPPLIPCRESMKSPCSDEESWVSSWAWEDKARRIFSSCTLINGTQIFAFSSQAALSSGDSVDLLWIDEDIAQPQYIPDWQARLSSSQCFTKHHRGGSLIWSARPHSENDAILRMSERAKAQANRKKPDVFEIVLKMTGNIHIDREEKRKRLESWTPEEARVFDEGEFTNDLVRVFRDFSPEVHCLPSQCEHDPLEKFLAERGYQVPFEWTNYLSLDPGHTHPAVVLAAVPPPEIGDYLVIWGEVYISGITAPQLAEQIVEISSGRSFEAFVIDDHFSRQTVAGWGDSIYSIYSKAFAQARLESHQTGSGFLKGTDNVFARNEVHRQWLAPRGSVGPKLRIIATAAPHTIREYGLYKKRITANEIQEAVLDQNNHSMDAIGYLTGLRPEFVPRRQRKTQLCPSQQFFLELKEEDEKRSAGDGSVYMGTRSSLGHANLFARG